MSIRGNALLPLLSGFQPLFQDRGYCCVIVCLPSKLRIYTRLRKPERPYSTCNHFDAIEPGATIAPQRSAGLPPPSATFRNLRRFPHFASATKKSKQNIVSFPLRFQAGGLHSAVRGTRILISRSAVVHCSARGSFFFCATMVM